MNIPVAWPCGLGHAHLAVCVGWCSLLHGLSIDCQHQKTSFWSLMMSGPISPPPLQFPVQYHYFSYVFVRFHVDPYWLWGIFIPDKNWSQVLSLVASTVIGTCVMSNPNPLKLVFNRQKHMFWNPWIKPISAIYDLQKKQMIFKWNLMLKFMTGKITIFQFYTVWKQSLWHVSTFAMESLWHIKIKTS